MCDPPLDYGAPDGSNDTAAGRQHPSDTSDPLPITVTYIPLDCSGPASPPIADCSAAAVQGLYVPLPANTDGLIVRCIRVR